MKHGSEVKVLLYQELCFQMGKTVFAEVHWQVLTDWQIDAIVICHPLLLEN